MTRVILKACGIEFEESGNTIWVQGPQGTLLRIQCSGQIRVRRCEAPGAHGDVHVTGDIEICVPASELNPEARAPGPRRERADLRVVGRRSGAVPAALAVVRRSPAAGAGTGKVVGRRAGRTR